MQLAVGILFEPSALVAALGNFAVRFLVEPQQFYGKC